MAMAKLLLIAAQALVSRLLFDFVFIHHIISTASLSCLTSHSVSFPFSIPLLHAVALFFSAFLCEVICVILCEAQYSSKAPQAVQKAVGLDNSLCSGAGSNNNAILLALLPQFSPSVDSVQGHHTFWLLSSKYLSIQAVTTCGNGSISPSQHQRSAPTHL